MKKRWFLIFIFILCSCTNYHLTIKEFRDIALFNGYYLDNTNNEYKNYSYVKDVCYAYSRESDYLIQFIELNNDDYAYKFFLTNKEAIQDDSNEVLYHKEKNSNNYNLYHIKTKEYIMIVIRMDNNIIYVNTTIDNNDTITSFFDELNIEY